MAKKKEVKDAKKQRRLDRKQQRESGEKADGDDSELDDADYYRQEVGEEPDAYMFPDKKKQKTGKETATTVQTPGQMAPSDKAHRFLKKAAGAPKGKVVRQRQQQQKKN